MEAIWINGSDWLIRLKRGDYMHLTKAPGYTAQAQAELALAALQNGMTANNDDMKLEYPGGAGEQSPWYVNTLSTSTLVLSTACVDTLVTRNDPRLPFIISPANKRVSTMARPLVR